MKKLLILCAFVLSAQAVDIRQDTLSNGLLVLSIEAHKLPGVLVRFMVPAGSRNDPPGREGLANLTNQMLIRGTAHYSGDALADAVESMGGDLSPFCDEDYAGLSSRMLAPDLPRFLTLMKECLFYPAFDSLQLTRLKREVISNIKAKEDDPFEVGFTAFRRMAFGAGPYAHEPAGYDTTVSAITVQDVRNYFQGAYGPQEEAFVVCVGDFAHDSLIILLEREFGDWPRVSGVSTDDIKHTTETMGCHYVGRIIKRDISQAYIFLGCTGPDLRAPDWNEARLMNYILGGSGLTSHISNSIREEQGLAYSASSYFYRFRYDGLYVAGVQTKKEMANQSVQSLIKEIGRMKEDVTAEELAWAKKYYIGHFPLTFDTYGELAGVAAQVQIESLGFDYFDRYEKMINDITLEQVKDAAGMYLYPSSFYLVVVGDLKKEDIMIPGIEWLEE